MATFFGSPPIVSPPVVRTQQLSSSSQSPPPPSPQPPQQPSQPPSLGKKNSSQESQLPLTAATNKAQRGGRSTSADSTDWIASSLTRRFGLGAGLAWAGFLTFGVVSEQIKTRFEVNQQEANTRDVEKEEEVVLPNGIRYYELRVGGGAIPRKGDLVVIDIKGNVVGDGVFVDTFGKDKKPLALVVGSRPYSKGMCEGVEMVLRTMKNGGKRRIIVPPALAFGDEGADFGSGFRIPPSATLEYIVEVEKVSIAPS